MRNRPTCNDRAIRDFTTVYTVWLVTLDNVTLYPTVRVQGEKEREV